MTELQKNFLSSFSGNIEISNSKTVCEINNNENIYFLAWVRNTKKRNNDNDIISKNYFVIDLDIRSWFRDNEWIEISDEEIKSTAETLKNYLKYWKFWISDWRYIVFSGNWLHIYYIWDEIEQLNSKYYSLWVKKFYELFEEFIWSEYIKPDYACRNIARIIRLPWTINQKNWKNVEILYEQDSKLKIMPKICELWKKYDEEIKKRRLEDAKEIIKRNETKLKMNTITYWEDWKKWQKKLEERIAKINSIPAYEISMRLLPEFIFSHNWKNFLNSNWEYTWFFYNDKTNTICNWWSHHYSWGDTNSCYSPLIMVQKFYWYTWKDTFDFFKTNYKI